MTQPRCLGYCVFEVSDLEKWRTFATEVVGMQMGRPTGGTALRLRIDDHENRVLLVQGPADDIVAAGWEFPTEDALDAYAAGLRRRGVEVTPGDEALAASRDVRKVYLCRDPNGWKHEFYFGAAIAPSPARFCSPLVKGGFVAGQLGVGHIVSVAHDSAKANAFYRDVLGLSVTDYIRAHTDLVPSGFLDVTFYHAAAGRHHSIAVAEFPGFPKSLNHLMIEANDITDVGLAFDRFTAAGIPILSMLGQHPNDRMISFYAATPSGFGLEFGWGGVVVDDRNWDVKCYSQPSLWGHKPVAAP
jgi:2,3-dihydroxybiphenyl 1,2-dioxygenase